MTILEPLRQYIVDQGGRWFSLAAAIEALNRPRLPILRAMDLLAKQGYIIEVKDEPVPAALGEYGRPRRNPTWRINPKKDLAGRPQIANPRKNTVRDKIWRLIRAQRRFTRSSIHRLASCSRDAVDDYCQRLQREKYIRQCGKEGREGLYILVRDTGPNRPRIPEKVAS